LTASGPITVRTFYPLSCDGDPIDSTPAGVEFLQRGAREGVAIMDMRFARGITLLICMGVGYLILLGSRKATGGKDEINPVTATVVGFALLMALCFLMSLVQSGGP
jgi:hypothetical protein